MVNELSDFSIIAPFTGSHIADWTGISWVAVYFEKSASFRFFKAGGSTF